LSQFIHENKKPTLPFITKMLKISKNDLTGFRFNSDNKKPIFEEMNNLRAIYKLCKNYLPQPFEP
jgi:hypothetical protein